MMVLHNFAAWVNEFWCDEMGENTTTLSLICTEGRWVMSMVVMFMLTRPMMGHGFPAISTNPMFESSLSIPS